MKTTENENAAAVEPIVICPTCNGEGGVDSGGQTPWGENINLPCPSCSGSSNDIDTLYQERKKDVLLMVKAIYPWLQKKADTAAEKERDKVWVTTENLFTMLNICHFIESLDMYEKKK